MTARHTKIQLRCHEVEMRYAGHVTHKQPSRRHYLKRPLMFGVSSRGSCRHDILVHNTYNPAPQGTDDLVGFVTQGLARVLGDEDQSQARWVEPALSGQ